MNTRPANDVFDPAAFDDLFYRLLPKITAFWNSEDAMRRDDKAGEVALIADTAVSDFFWLYHRLPTTQPPCGLWHKRCTPTKKCKFGVQFRHHTPISFDGSF